MVDKENKIKRIQVPNKYINNKKFHFNAFYLYVILKMVCVDNHVHIYSKKLLDKLGWTKYNLKKYLDILKQEKLITYDFDSLPYNKPLEIEILPIVQRAKTKEDYFTQVDTRTIEKIITYGKEVRYYIKGEKEIKDEKEKALKLFYVYEMFYNDNYGKSFISYQGIYEATGYNNACIKSINNMFHRKDIVNVMLGDWYEQENEEDELISLRERNNYVPNCIRAKQKN
jgi:hypothetical protein